MKFVGESRHDCQVGTAENPTRYQARCSCGWWGPSRIAEADCFRDQNAHLCADPGWWFPQDGYKPSEREVR